MFFIRYSWTLPLKAQCAVGFVLLAVLGWMHGADAKAKEFAAFHHTRCVQRHVTATTKGCTSRTIQLALQMHGAEFGDRVAKALN